MEGGYVQSGILNTKILQRRLGSRGGGDGANSKPMAARNRKREYSLKITAGNAPATSYAVNRPRRNLRPLNIAKPDKFHHTLRDISTLLSFFFGFFLPFPLVLDNQFCFSLLPFFER